MANESKNLFKAALSEIWWLVLLRGIVATLFGILLLLNPGTALILIMIYIGVYLLLDGIFTLVASLQCRKQHADWGWGVFTGIISILAGLVIVSQPGIAAFMSTTFLVYLVGFLAIVSGISSVATGIRLRKSGNEWSMIIGGVLTLLLGILLIAHPVVTTFTLTILVGGFAIIGGIFLVASAIQVRKVGKAI